ncbi:MAG: NUDIX hydrolase [Pseudolabrys sp.]|jgi:8-oxo-dGTP pyrophosphatase MutT (NUDIX family)
MSGPSVFHVERLALAFAPRPWAFAADRRAEIDAFFEKLKRDRPAVWNGRVLLLHHQVVRDGVFSGEFLETDYASFAAWTAWGRPPAGVRDCFGAAALLAADGAFLLGVMGLHTFHAGHIYFPCGTPDPTDIANGKVDLDFSVWRELEEETGLTAADVEREPGWTTVVDGGLIAQIKLLRARQDAESLRTRILAHLSREKQPELTDIRIVRGRDDFNEAMPRYVTAFLDDYFVKA